MDTHELYTFAEAAREAYKNNEKVFICPGCKKEAVIQRRQVHLVGICQNCGVIFAEKA